ncbi:cation:proton antiporter [Fusibacter tunisiensis]|uniref:Kef-type K+ transport system membrane component KefB n=1 Tax=Fusibacter tunisiensis TaxID=1008308 RepID=A0ABS2MPH5_9FIRM|nr:cation:proton antiporter [Fusibacter tunisiensis]MBM7561289.1 Kef-type K+ transport system membrane component KefB [Fusibacter tunisiensis]
MESSYWFMVQLALILLAANVAGKLSEKFKQPAVMGQILIGLVLGAGLMEKTEIIEQFAQIGVVFLMFIAGLETDVKELLASIKSSSLIALGGIVFPAFLVFAGMMIVFPNQSMLVALFLGIVSTATSVSISVQTLREIHQLRTKQGLMILGAAIIDDIAGIILLTLLVGLVKPGASSSVGVVTLKIVAFFTILYAVGFVVVKFLRKIKDDVVGDEQIIVFSIILCFILAFMSEEFGVAAITGAYFAGVIFSMTSFKHRVSHDVNKVSNLLFTPIFFVGIGMDINLSAAATAVGVGSLLIVMGIIGKIVGCGLGARLSGFTLDDSLQIGVGMVPRAEVAIIVANLGLQMAILSEKDMAATVVMVLVTTLVTPSMLKWTFNRVHKSVA